MAIDPCYSEMLAGPHSAMVPPASGMSLEFYRSLIEAPLVENPVVAVHAAIDRQIMCADRAIAVRIYHPTQESALPVILFYHGGGFVLCSAASHDAMCRELALKSGAVVVSVDYRRAPEAPFPGPLNDCYDAFEWVTNHAEEINVDPMRIAVCGDSAGGNLAIATALRARETGLIIRYMGIIYPMIDPQCGFPSIATQSTGPVLSQQIIEWFWECYLGASGNSHDPLAAVLTADLRNLPAATVLTAEYDPLRDEGEAFARALRAAGNATVTRRYLGMAHGFFSMPKLTPIAGHAMTDLAQDFRTALAR